MAGKVWGKSVRAQRFGNPTDYTAFDSKGHMRMFGAARPWRDEIGDALSLKLQGTGIALNAAEGVQEFAANANLSDYLYKNLQVNHDRDETAVIYPHLHFLQASAAMPNFMLQYRWQINGGAKVTAWTNIRCNIPAFAYVPGTIQQIAHTVAGIAPPAQSTVSDIIQFRIIRDNANASGLFLGADGYAGAAGVLSFDTHIQLNSVGSDEQYVK